MYRKFCIKNYLNLIFLPKLCIIVIHNKTSILHKNSALSRKSKSQNFDIVISSNSEVKTDRTCPMEYKSEKKLATEQI